MTASAGDEIERIRSAYRERDAATGAPWQWGLRGYRRGMQELEWALLEGLSGLGVDLRGLRVAEVGCGSGYFLSRFLDYGAGHAAGIDLVEERVAYARGRDPRLELVAGDAAELPWPSGSFDIVSQFTCLSSVLDARLRLRIVDEMWRITRPGGVLISYDIRPTSLPVAAVRRLVMRGRGGSPAPRTPTTPVPSRELEQLPATRRVRRSLTLMGELAPLAERSAAGAGALARLPFLRTHQLVLAQKDQ